MKAKHYCAQPSNHRKWQNTSHERKRNMCVRHSLLVYIGASYRLHSGLRVRSKACCPRIADANYCCEEHQRGEAHCRRDAIPRLTRGPVSACQGTQLPAIPVCPNSGVTRAEARKSLISLFRIQRSYSIRTQYTGCGEDVPAAFTQLSFFLSSSSFFFQVHMQPLPQFPSFWRKDLQLLLIVLPLMFLVTPARLTIPVAGTLACAQFTPSLCVSTHCTIVTFFFLYRLLFYVAYSN